MNIRLGNSNNNNNHNNYNTPKRRMGVVVDGGMTDLSWVKLSAKVQDG